MSESVLDREIDLVDVFEPELFAELCRSYVDLYLVGIRVYDRGGALVVDLPFNEGLQMALLAVEPARQRLLDFMASLKSIELDVDDVAIRDERLTGAHYIVAPITSDLMDLGRIIVGPYFPDASEIPGGALPPPDPADPIVQAVGVQRYLRLHGEQRRMLEAALLKVVFSLQKTIDVVCHAGYKSYLTSNLHRESIATAHGDLQRKNRQLRQRNNQLRELDRLKSNFLATVSHELRTPLTSVIGYSEILLEGLAGELSEEQRAYVKTIMDKGETLLHLISGILDISKIESGGVTELVRQHVPAEVLVEGALSTCRLQAEKKGLRLTVSDTSGLPTLHVDTYKVRQALINLLSNAIKFTPTGGKVSLRIDRHKGGLRCEVSDTGIGIPADKLGRVFETFFQVDNTSTREHGGTGLGLSIVKSFVESHGGEVTVESVRGEGSTFAFTLPASAIQAGD